MTQAEEMEYEAALDYSEQNLRDREYSAAERQANVVDSGSAPHPQPVAWRYQDSRGHYRYRGYKPGFDREYSILQPVPLYSEPIAAEQMDAERVCLAAKRWEQGSLSRREFAAEITASMGHGRDDAS